MRNIAILLTLLLKLGIVCPIIGQQQGMICYDVFTSSKWKSRFLSSQDTLYFKNSVSLHTTTEQPLYHINEPGKLVAQYVPQYNRYLTNFNTKISIKQLRLPNDSLIRTTIPSDPLNWTLHADTRVIQGYTCQKATAVDEYDTPIEVWYTLDIPLSHGPRSYYGLPGLVLEVTQGMNWVVKVVCTKIEFIPVADEQLALNTGEMVTKEKYDRTYKKLTPNSYNKKKM